MTAAHIRSLTALVESASTTRLLNLARRERREVDGAPLFHAEPLERAIILKHRLRREERETFLAPRRIATKVLVPIDPEDLSAGAFSFMIGQKGFEDAVRLSLNLNFTSEAGAHDRSVLCALDELPSLDPFLTREHLARRGVKVSDDHFHILQADVVRMQAFASREIVPLVDLCFGGQVGPAFAERLAHKILASELDDTLDPLRTTLRMSETEFVEGVFCWKGFLYYKWLLEEVVAAAEGMRRRLDQVRPVGRLTPDEAAYFPAARERIKRGMTSAVTDARYALTSYDAAFAQLTERAEPAVFREFLLGAPNLFFEIGDKLATLQHVCSLWAQQFGDEAAEARPDVLTYLLLEMEECLGVQAGRA